MTLAPARPAVACDGALPGGPVVDPVLAAEAERGRLADQLHTGLLQSLVVARHAIAREQQPRGTTAAPGLPTADEALVECLTQTRRLVWHLRPRTLDAGIAHALDELAHRLADDRRVALDVVVADLDLLTGPQAALVYRVVQAAALAAPDGSSIEVTVSGTPEGGAVVRLGGHVSAAEADVEVGDWVLRASGYDVIVELVRS